MAVYFDDIEQKYCRDCPTCGKVIKAKTRSYVYKADKNKHNCTSCSRKLTLEQNPMSEETKLKISKSLSGENHPNWGTTRSNKTKKKIGEANKGNTHDSHKLGWKHHMIEKYGLEEAERRIKIKTEKQRKKVTGLNHTQETKDKISKTLTGITKSPETRRKMREGTLKYIHNTKGQVSPRYNISSISIIEEKAKELGITDLQHAENGGEFQVLGYFVDGYSKEKNIVIEYDEKHHFDTNGHLRKRDVVRQKEIEEYLGCTFIRIKEI
jgi:hypothetical protein